MTGKWQKKITWKTRWFLSILFGVLLVIFLLFGSTYFYFVKKLNAANERIVYMSFRETEENLRGMLKNAEDDLNRFSYDDLVWSFVEDSFATDVEKSISVSAVVNSFDQMLDKNRELYGLGILSGGGRSIVSTTEHKSRTGAEEPREALLALLAEARESYPYVYWTSGKQLGIPETSSLYCLVNRPVLVGIKALGEAEDPKDDSYLLAAIDEDDVQKSYRTVSYNGSRAALLDQEGRIISATDAELLYTAYAPRDSDQNIEYSLSYYQWKLVNMIPKKEYLREAWDIRNFGVAVGALAALAVILFCVIWNRKYTRPIQILMDQMDMVKEGDLKIREPEKVGWPELDRLNSQFYDTVQELKGYIGKLQAVEKEKAREELLALQYQINPHFLYNSLNSIRWMAMMTNNTKVADSLVTLCRIIMPVLRNPSFTWKLKDELEFLENYVKMMQIRYGNQMEYRLECDGGIMEETFPRFILQPVIENCFVHGSSQSEIRDIYVSIRKTERFAIEILNTGVFPGVEAIERTNEKIARGVTEGNGIGLANVRKRLNLLYGDRGDVWVETDPERGFLVYICF